MKHFSPYAPDRYEADGLPPLPRALEGYLSAHREANSWVISPSRWESLWETVRGLPLAELEATEERLRDEVYDVRGPFVDAHNAAASLPEDATPEDVAAEAERYTGPANAYLNAHAHLHVYAVARYLADAYGAGYVDRKNWDWLKAEEHDVSKRFKDQETPTLGWDAYRNEAREIQDEDGSPERMRKAFEDAWNYAVDRINRGQVSELLAFIGLLSEELDRSKDISTVAHRECMRTKSELSQHDGNILIYSSIIRQYSYDSNTYILSIYNQFYIQNRLKGARSVLRRFTIGAPYDQDAKAGEAARMQTTDPESDDLLLRLTLESYGSPAFIRYVEGLRGGPRKESWPLVFARYESDCERLRVPVAASSHEALRQQIRRKGGMQDDPDNLSA